MLNVPIKELSILLLLAIMWSLSFTVIKIGIEDIPPVTFAALRIAVAAAVLWGWMSYRGGRMDFTPRVWMLLALIGVFGNVLPFALINWGEMKISSGLAATLISLMPLSALVLGRVFSDEILNLPRIAGILMGLAGVVILIGPEELLGLGDNVWRQLAVTAGAVCYAIAGILIRKLPEKRPAEHGSGILVAATAIMIPASIFMEQPWTVDYTVGGFFSVMYLGIFPTALATILLIEVISRRGVTFLSLNNYLIPAFGVMWGVLFLGETVSTTAIGGLALILAGIALAGTGPATTRDAPGPDRDNQE